MKTVVGGGSTLADTCHNPGELIVRTGTSDLGEQDPPHGPFTDSGQVLVYPQMGEDPPPIGGTVDDKGPAVAREVACVFRDLVQV